MDRPKHEIENGYIVYLVQVLYGAISRNLRALHISEASESGFSLHFLLEVDNPIDREEIDEICFELEALQGHSVELKVDVSVGDSFEALTSLPGRGVYHRKEELE